MIDALCVSMGDPGPNVRFDPESGQIEHLDNWRTAHARTEYVGYKDPDRRRHLVRIFLRDEGARGYMG